MNKNLPYIIGSGTAAVAAVLTCYYFRRKRNVGDSDFEPGISRVPSLIENAKADAGPQKAITHQTSSNTESIASGIIHDTDGTVTLKTSTNPVLKAESITLSRLKQLVKGVPGQKTIYAVAEELYNLEEGAGGALIVIYDCKGGKNPEATMPVKSMGGGKLRNVMRQYARTLFLDDSEGAAVNPNFRAILQGFCSVDHVGKYADKWTQPVLESMAANLEESWDSADLIRLLLHEPADGALAILSLRGTVVGASSRIDIQSNHEPSIELMRKDGKGTGTKHKAAICAVEWCRLKQLQGAAIVRSDAGRVTFVGIEGTGKKQTKAYEIVG